jgi:peptide subunit release factor RF-3
MLDEVFVAGVDEGKIAGGDAVVQQAGLALDGDEQLVYLAPTRANLALTLERWPDISFQETREHLASAA